MYVLFRVVVIRSLVFSLVRYGVVIYVCRSFFRSFVLSPVISFVRY